MNRPAFATRLATFVFSAVMLGTAVSRADDASTNRARAQQLFESALADVKAGNYGAACPKFAASAEAEPKTSTLLNLGSCYESVGRLASAWAAFREAEGVARRSSRADLEARARSAAEALAPKLVRLTITIPEASRLPGLVVSRGESKLAQAEWGVGIPVDDGHYVVSASAPGYQTWRTELDIRGSDRVVQIGSLARAAEPVEVDGDVRPASWWTPLRTTGVVMSGVGAASAIAGVVVALVAKSNYDDARSRCQAADDCPRDAVTDSDSARSLATGGTVAIVAGASLLAVGGGLLLFSPRSVKREEPRVSAGLLGPAMLGVTGAW